MKVQATARLVGYLRDGQHELFSDAASSVGRLNVEVLEEHGSAQPRRVAVVIERVSHDVAVGDLRH